MLEQADVAPYLLSRGLLEPRAVVDDDLVIRDASSRNRNYRVERKRGPSLLLKQGLGPEGSAAVAYEASVYRFLSAQDGFSSCLPRFYGYDPEAGVLAIELVGRAEDLRSYHLRRGRFPVGLATATGRALGSLHRLTRVSGERDVVPEQAPLVLSLHRPDASIFRDASAASIELIKIIQQAPRLGERLDELRQSWRPQALIHRDVKWDNVIVVPTGSGRNGGIRLVDWEAAGRGDPCWDIGSVFSHYLSFWLFSIPITGESPPERFPELARYRLEKMQPAIRRSWQAYVAQVGLDPRAAQEWLLRAVGYAAGRLVQTAFEATQVATQLTGGIVLHLQLSANMLERRREAAVHLLGLAPTGP